MLVPLFTEYAGPITARMTFFMETSAGNLQASDEFQFTYTVGSSGYEPVSAEVEEPRFFDYIKQFFVDIWTTITGWFK